MCSSYNFAFIYGTSSTSGVKDHPVMTGSFHAYKQIIYRDINLFDAIQKQIQTLIGIGKRKISKHFFPFLIQHSCNMSAFCNVNSQSPHLSKSPFNIFVIKDAQLGVTPVQHVLAAKSVQIRASSGKCIIPVPAVFARGHSLKVSKPNSGTFQLL